MNHWQPPNEFNDSESFEWEYFSSELLLIRFIQLGAAVTRARCFPTLDNALAVQNRWIELIDTFNQLYVIERSNISFRDF